MVPPGPCALLALSLLILGCGPVAPQRTPLPEVAPQVRPALPLVEPTPRDVCASSNQAFAQAFWRDGRSGSYGLAISARGDLWALGLGTLTVFGPEGSERESARVCEHPLALRFIEERRAALLCRDGLYEVTAPGLAHRRLLARTSRASQAVLGARWAVLSESLGPTLVLRADDLAPVLTLTVPGGANGVALAPREDAVALGGKDGQVWLWRPPEPRPQVFKVRDGLVKVLAFLDDHSLLVDAFGLRRLDLRTGRNEPLVAGGGWRAQGDHAALLADGEPVLGGSEGLSLPRGAALPQGGLRSVAQLVSAGGRVCAAGAFGGLLCLVDCRRSP